MKTLLVIVPLIISSVVAWKVSLFVLNVAGLPGALIARGTSDKFESIAATLRFFVGVIISTVGQSYVYLAFVALIVNFTKSEVQGGGVFGPVLWPIAFIASFAPVFLCTAAAIFEAGGGAWNVQVAALCFTEVLAVIAFFLFVFFPSLITLGWLWIPYGSR
jgi:hypothetical protein